MTLGVCEAAWPPLMQFLEVWPTCAVVPDTRSLGTGDWGGREWQGVLVGPDTAAVAALAHLRTGVSLGSAERGTQSQG